jgi:hypothetical protein
MRGCHLSHFEKQSQQILEGWMGLLITLKVPARMPQSCPFANRYLKPEVNRQVNAYVLINLSSKT